MSESISLDVQSNVPKCLLDKLYGEVTPNYVRGLLVEYGLAKDRRTIDAVTCSYASGFPTEDLALKAHILKECMKFWGIASGPNYREEKIAVKYLILERIRTELAAKGIHSEVNIADLTEESIDYLNEKGVLGSRLAQLRKIAKRKGNIENIAIELLEATRLPV